MVRYANKNLLDPFIIDSWQSISTENRKVISSTYFLVHSHARKFKGYFSIFPRIESREKDEKLMRLK